MTRQLKAFVIYSATICAFKTVFCTRRDVALVNVFIITWLPEELFIWRYGSGNRESCDYFFHLYTPSFKIFDLVHFPRLGASLFS